MTPVPHHSVLRRGPLPLTAPPKWPPALCGTPRGACADRLRSFDQILHRIFLMVQSSQISIAHFRSRISPSESCDSRAKIVERGAGVSGGLGCCELIGEHNSPFGIKVPPKGQ